MTVRVFTDAAGARWPVWDVIPTPPDRRSGRDRRTEAIPGPWREQRRRPERRVRDVGRPAAVAEPFVGGWLAFGVSGAGAASVRRRLAPIPPGWAGSSEADLRALLEQAAPAPPLSRTA